MDSGIIEVHDSKYPAALKEALAKIQASLGPKNLYYKGNWDNKLFANCLAVVGSRRLTYYGKKATEQIAGQAAAAGITIVSGFMYGGDEAAHSAALKFGGKTIAVMPCGIERVHPENQKKLYQEILDQNGLVVSEYEGEAQPQNFTYIQRDRIVAGLAKAVLVTEAALDSGTLITASYAKKFGRKIFALPGPITSEVSKGSLKLIKEGAELVTSAQDILDYFKISAKASQSPSFASASPGGSSSAGATLEQKILDQLGREPLKADDLARLFSVPASQLGTTLSLMELKGIINQNSGKFYLN